MTSVPLPATAQPRLRHATVSGIGTHIPSGVITNADLETMVETSDSWIMERTGIRTRHQVGGGETTASMGASAARQAMAMAGIDSVDAIICATCSPDTLMPATACLIQRDLSRDFNVLGVPAFDINAACSGYVYAIQVATSLVRGGSADRVLLIASESMTRLVDYQDRSTCVLFGDGAGATVISVADAPGLRAIHWGADGSQAEIIYYGPMQDNADSPDALRMAGRGTFRLAVDRLCAMCEEVAAESGWSLADIDHVVPHQANQRIIEAAAKRLGFPMDRVLINLDEVGNTSAASIPLALGAAHAQGRVQIGDKILAVAFGAGATWGGFALEWAP